MDVAESSDGKLEYGSVLDINLYIFLKEKQIIITTDYW
jgi:hypothetical protein